MKILVTGAAGFIGFHVADDLVKRGQDVVGIDNINDYYDENLKYARLHELGINQEKDKTSSNFGQEGLQFTHSSKYDNYRFLKLDITDLNSLERLFKDEKFDSVINLAAQAGVRYSIENPHAYIQSNIVGFVNILECCRLQEVSHLIYASSSSVYGERSKVPFSENEKVGMPVSLYAATKRSNELMAHSYSHLYGLATTGLRFFTVYGPWGRPDMAPMLFTDAIRNGRSINVFNDGNMQRDFTYVTDVVEGVVKLTLRLEEERSKSEIFNIGNSKPIQLMDFISGLEREMGKEAIKNFMPMQDGDVKMTYADSTKLEKAVGYKPTTDLNTGLHKFVHWYKAYHKS